MYEIEASVGRGGENRPMDVLKTFERFSELGFHWADSLDVLPYTIRLFQSIMRGSEVLIGDGRIDPGYMTEAALNRADAPKWVLMSRMGPGYVNFERTDQADQFDYGTSWLQDVIDAAGRDYLKVAKPQYAPITINDVSLPWGGPNRDHAGHETGMSMDLRVPRSDGGAGGVTWRNSEYDRDAMMVQLVAINTHDRVRKVLFNDPELVKMSLCSPYSGHDNHVHVEIRAI